MLNFGGMATSRLDRNLRLEKHWSYGSSGTVVDARGQRPFMVIAPVQTDRTKEAMNEVAKEIRGVAGERPLIAEEYESVIRSQTMRLPGRFETLASLESAATSIINYGYPDDYYANYARNVRDLDEAAFAAAAGRFVRPDEVIWVVTRRPAADRGGRAGARLRRDRSARPRRRAD
jgi:zinc protease